MTTINQPKKIVFDYIRMLKNQDNFSVWAWNLLPVLPGQACGQIPLHPLKPVSHGNS
jgi:hypothetical protein